MDELKLYKFDEDSGQITLDKIIKKINKDSEKKYVYNHYLEIYNKNKINYEVLSKYISEDNIINYINEYINYNLKEINAAIIIQKKLKKSIIYKNYRDKALLAHLFIFLRLIVKFNFCNRTTFTYV